MKISDQHMKIDNVYFLPHPSQLTHHSTLYTGRYRAQCYINSKQTKWEVLCVVNMEAESLFPFKIAALAVAKRLLHQTVTLMCVHKIMTVNIHQ